MPRGRFAGATQRVTEVAGPNTDEEQITKNKPSLNKGTATPLLWLPTLPHLSGGLFKEEKNINTRLREGVQYPQTRAL